MSEQVEQLSFLLVDEVLDHELDADINFFNEIYPSLSENKSNQYFTNISFNNLMRHGNNRNLSVIHINIRSLNANGDTLVGYLSTLDHSFDAICLTETWNYDIRTINEMFPQYSAFSSNRNNRNGGGAAVLIKSNYESSIIAEHTVNQSYIESVFVRISSQKIFFYYWVHI